MPTKCTKRLNFDKITRFFPKHGRLNDTKYQRTASKDFLSLSTSQPKTMSKRQNLVKILSSHWNRKRHWRQKSSKSNNLIRIYIHKSKMLSKQYRSNNQRYIRKIELRLSITASFHATLTSTKETPQPIVYRFVHDKSQGEDKHAKLRDSKKVNPQRLHPYWNANHNSNYRDP